MRSSDSSSNSGSGSAGGRGGGGSSSIPTRYGLDGSGIDCRWGARFSAPVQAGPGVSLHGIKRPGRDVDHPHPSSAQVDGSVELYLCSLSGPSWPGLVCSLLA